MNSTTRCGAFGGHLGLQGTTSSRFGRAGRSGSVGVDEEGRARQLALGATAADDAVAATLEHASGRRSPRRARRGGRVSGARRTVRCRMDTLRRARSGSRVGVLARRGVRWDLMGRARAQEDWDQQRPAMLRPTMAVAHILAWAGRVDEARALLVTASVGCWSGETRQRCPSSGISWPNWTVGTASGNADLSAPSMQIVSPCRRARPALDPWLQPVCRRCPTGRISPR